MQTKPKGTPPGDGTSPASPAVTVRSLLVNWANQQDSWVRQLVSEIILAGKALTDAQLDAIYQLFLKEKTLAAGGPVSVPALSDDPSLLVAGSGLSLTRLSDLKNVNALAESQQIDFNAKLTIVFGENACGKTGYVRVLKNGLAAAIMAGSSTVCGASDGKAKLLYKQFGVVSVAPKGGGNAPIYSPLRTPPTSPVKPPGPSLGHYREPAHRHTAAGT